MDEEERAILEAAALAVLDIPYNFVFVCKDGLPVEVKVVVRK